MRVVHKHRNEGKETAYHSSVMITAVDCSIANVKVPFTFIVEVSFFTTTPVPSLPAVHCMPAHVMLVALRADTPRGLVMYSIVPLLHLLVV